MQHFFIINPAAGKRSSEKEIRELIDKHRIKAEVYITQKPNDATDYVKNICKKNSGLKRFWACGGDGTLNETLNGMAGFLNAELACYPCGSGNDYVKCFGAKDGFLDMEKQLLGTAKPVDILEVNGRYAINEINFGFDSVAAAVMQKVKRKPIIGGKNSYIAGALYALINSINNACRVYAEDKLLNKNGRLLLCTVMCGKYTGGQFLSAPNAKLDDGLIDVTIIKPLSRLKLLALIKKYEDGSYLTDPEIQDFIIYNQLERVRFEAPEGFKITIDGESMDISQAEIRLIPRAVKFIVPKGQESA